KRLTVQVGQLVDVRILARIGRQIRYLQYWCPLLAPTLAPGREDRLASWLLVLYTFTLQFDQLLLQVVVRCQDQIIAVRSLTNSLAHFGVLYIAFQQFSIIKSGCLCRTLPNTEG